MMYHYASEKYVCFPRYIVLVFWVQHLSITISTQQSILKTNCYIFEKQLFFFFFGTIFTIKSQKLLRNKHVIVL